MIIAGIDPGKAGGVATICSQTREVSVQPMPLAGAGIDGRELTAILSQAEFAALEEPQIRDGESGRSSLTIGRNHGLIEGVLQSLGVPYEIVRPQEWKRVLGIPAVKAPPVDASLSGKELKRAKSRRQAAMKKKAKELAVAYCLRRYPNVSLLATERSRVPHDGMADALCIATYGLLRERGEEAA